MPNITVSGRGFTACIGKQSGSTPAAQLINGATFQATQFVNPASATTVNNVVPPAAPGILFPRWLDGSEHGVTAEFAHEQEGDGQRGESLSFKQFQYGMATHICNPRPEEFAFLAQAFTGHSSNSVVADASAYTLTTTGVPTGGTFTLLIGGVTVGPINYNASAANVLSAINTALGTSGTTAYSTSGGALPTGVVMTPAANTLWRGIRIAVLSSAGLTGGTSPAAVITPTAVSGQYNHTIAPADVDTGNDYYTISSWLAGDTTGASSKPFLLQTGDAVCHEMIISGQAGEPIKLETHWSGGVNRIVDSSTIDVTTGQLSPVPVSTYGPRPYYFYNGTWTLQNVSGAISTSIKQFSFTFTAAMTQKDYQASGIFPLPLVVGNVTFTGSVTVLWQSWDAYAQAYFGGTASARKNKPDADPSDTGASTTGTGNVLLMLASSDASSNPVTAYIEFPLASYEGATQRPEVSGRPIEQQMTVHPIKGNSTYLQRGGAQLQNKQYAISVLCNVGSAW